MTLSNKERLSRFYDRFDRSDRVLIVINADPDAISSAMAVKRILWRRVTGIGLSNINAIARPDNRAMVRLLNVRLTHISKIDADQYNKFVIVDSQPHHNESFSRFDYTAIIDHHPDESDAPFKDIRPEYGATATIMTEYLRAAQIRPSARLATGMFFGIKTDTNDFERPAVNADIQAFQYLFRYANASLVRKIEQADLRLDFLDYFKKALDNHVISRNRIYVHLGRIKNPDICVIIADFFMRVNTVTWSIVSGISENRLIIIVRNDGLRRDAGRVANLRFGPFGTAGGHKSIARAEIPLEGLRDQIDYNDEDLLLGWIISRFEKKR
jgi:nanoRNase/pAp phosphatase (c-di-AMP/oligoRNAs hydrolase)